MEVTHLKGGLKYFIMVPGELYVMTTGQLRTPTWFADSLSAITSAGFGRGSGKIWMDNVDCNGNERRLKLCNHVGWEQHYCHHDEDAGVLCSPGNWKIPFTL